VNEAGGTVGDRYALLERIGSGAMGVVWRARDELLHREVAIKQLRLPDLGPAESEVARTRAMREARIAARLHHPNAITVFDVVVVDDQPWLVMEYLPSRSLAALLVEQGPLDPVETARIGGHVAAALAAAHAAGIVHRDVKPSNVLIGNDGTVKLTDFGISRATGDGTLTDKGMISGTPAYLAPEVARGESPDALSDVFSLGATLFAATERKSPYGHSENSLGLLYRAAIGQIDVPTNAGPLTGPLAKLLSGDPAERPTSSQVVQLLADVREQPAPAPEKPKTKPQSKAQPKPKPKKARRRWLVPVVVGAVLLAAAGTTAWIVEHPNGGGGSSGNTSQAGNLTPTEAANFALDYCTLLRDDPRSAWDKLAAPDRPDVESYAQQWGQFEHIAADGNPEVFGDGVGGFFVDVKVTLTRGGTEDTEIIRLDVRRENGQLTIVGTGTKTPVSAPANPTP
jgi:serine/threonine protein kinase